MMNAPTTHPTTLALPAGQPALKQFYLICTGLTVVISWGIFATFLGSGEASVGAFFQQAFGSAIATLVSSDVILSALILLFYIRIEIKRLGMPARSLALYILATFSVGVCGALALFLYRREAWLIEQAA